jgi:hypothetical protein
VSTPDRDLVRLLKEACPPIDPPDGFERRVRRAVAARRQPGAALVRFLVPYAAGVLTVLCVERARPVEPLPTIATAPSSAFALIADRAPAPPPPAPAEEPEPDASPVPRIS